MNTQSLFSNPVSVASGSALTSFPDNNGNSFRVYYIGNDNHIHEIRANDQQPWAYRDLNVQANANAVINSASATTGFLFPGSSSRIYFIGTDSHIYEIVDRGSGQWVFADISHTSNAPNAEQGAITSFLFPGESPRVYFIGTDSHIYELAYDGNYQWHYTDISGRSNAPEAAQGAITSFLFPGESPRVYFIGTDSHIYELAYDGDGNWHYTDLSADPYNAPEAATGSSITSFLFQGEYPRVYYNTKDCHVYELAYQGNFQWQPTDISNKSNAHDAAADSAITSFGLPGGESIFVYYVGQDNSIYEIAYQGDGNWVCTPTSSGSQVDTGSITSFYLGSSPHVCYINKGDKAVYVTT